TLVPEGDIDRHVIVSEPGGNLFKLPLVTENDAGYDTLGNANFFDDLGEGRAAAHVDYLFVKRHAALLIGRVARDCGRPTQAMLLWYSHHAEPRTFSWPQNPNAGSRGSPHGHLHI